MNTINKHKMSYEQMTKLITITVSPYLMYSYELIDKPRMAGGNMFRHQLNTFTVLLDYGYCDPVLLKAAVVHDVIEDIPDFDETQFLKLEDGPAVLSLVKEVSKRKGEKKPVFLTRIKNEGSFAAKILKCADRIDNVISLGIVTDLKFVEKYVLETEKYIYPIAEEVNKNMLQELMDLIVVRRKLMIR